MSLEQLNLQLRSCFESALAPLKLLLTVSILFPVALGIFCFVTLGYPLIEHNVMVQIASIFMGGSAFTICLSHLAIQYLPKRKYTCFNKIIGCLVLIFGVAYFVANIIAISNPMYCNYPLCALKMIQFIILPLCICFTICLDQLKCLNKKNRQKWLEWLKWRYFSYSFIFLFETVCNMTEFISYSVHGIMFDKTYIWMTTLTNLSLGFFSLLLIVIFCINTFRSENTNHTIKFKWIRACLWMIVISASCLMVWNFVYILLYKYQVAWLAHYGLLFVIALLFGSHDTECCFWIGEYQVTPDSSKERQHQQQDDI